MASAELFQDRSQQSRQRRADLLVAVGLGSACVIAETLWLGFLAWVGLRLIGVI
ncbi:hypothetical protein [Alsobacter soli]|uniref:hypothetical protein n=1 Tax=Alsobacter soli TaxID=2109933 RepID=UPI001304AAB8|nr:hypothetical protein [Alsobacter soli]